MVSAAKLKKQAALLTNLTHALDQYETERKRSTAPPRSNFHTAQPTIAFLQSVQPTLDALAALQPAFPPASPPTLPLPARLQRFSGWLQSVAPDCGIGRLWELQAGGADGEEGNGVVAKCALAPSSLLMTIPRRAILWVSSFADEASAYHSPDTAAFAAKLLDLRDPMLTGMPALLLALLLLFERQRGAASPLHAYLDVLPTHFSLPLFTPADELRHLSHSPALLSVASLQYNTLMQYVYLNRLLASARLLSPAFPFHWHAFRWAVSVLYTRQNRVCEALCLIPGWDMCNHRAAVGGIRTFYHAEREQSDTYIADDVAVEAGEPVYIYYGDRSNRDLFVYSGFVDAHNEQRDYELLWTDDGREAVLGGEAEAGQKQAVGAGDWSRIRLLMRKKAGVEGAVTVKLPLPYTEAEWEAEKYRRWQRRMERRTRRQQAWQQWELRSGEKRSEEQLSQEAEEDEQEDQAAADKANKEAESNEARLQALLSLLRLEALRTKEEAMDALRLQSGTGGYVGQLNTAHELRARQLLLRWLQYEQRLYGEADALGSIERQLKELERSTAVEQAAQQRLALMLRVQLDGLQVLRESQVRVERWIAQIQ